MVFSEQPIPEWRGRRLGRARRARADGRLRLALHTRTVMEHARRIYDRLGFRREPRPDFRVGEVGLVGYVLELDPARGH